jgi:neutral trehalase
MIHQKLILSILAALLLPLSQNARQLFIGAYDPAHWTGLTLTSSDKRGFGFYLEIEKEGKRVSGYDIFYLIKKVGPNSGDGRYARLVIDTSLPFQKKDRTPIRPKSLPSDSLTWEWSRYENYRVCGRISLDADVTVRIHFYSPWDYLGDYHHEQNHIHGISGGEHFYFASNPAGIANRMDSGMSLSYRIKRGESILFGCRVAPEENSREIMPDNVAELLEDNQRSYQNHRVRISGRDASLVDSITNNINWMVSLRPEIPALYTPAGRRWIFPSPKGGRDHWTIFEWDAFFNALELSVESFALAKKTVRAVLDTQYPNGNIPNWRSRWAGTTDRSQPPVGSYVVLRLYQRFRDMEFLRHAYPKLKKFNRFWTAPVRSAQPRRDGNKNGLLEWGSDTERLADWMPEWERGVDGRTRAAWESGQDDLPNYDDIPFNKNTNTLELDCVDLNSLYALDCECLATMAEILGYRTDQRQFMRSHREIKERMNKFMWDDRVGIYKDRHWDGRLSDKLAAANFFPMIAGIPDKTRATRMRRLLKQPDLFWGKYMVATINKADPAYGDQQYWRGTIWPPTNYLVYRGLSRYGFYTTAAHLARKSTALFLNSWNTHQLCRENYDSRTGVGGGRRYQSWGPLFALIGLEEYIDWKKDGGIRMGSAIFEGKSILENIKDWRNTYQITLSEDGFRGVINGKITMSAPSPLVIDDLEISDSTCRMQVFSTEATRLSITGWEARVFRIQSNSRSTLSEELNLVLSPGKHVFLIEKIQ